MRFLALPSFYDVLNICFGATSLYSKNVTSMAITQTTSFRSCMHKRRIKRPMAVGSCVYKRH